MSKSSVRTNIDTIFERIEDERDYQVCRWGHRQPDGSFLEEEHSVGDFLVYMQDYLNEAFHLASRENGSQGALENLRKVVTLGVACFEQHGIPGRDLSIPWINGRDGQPT